MPVSLVGSYRIIGPLGTGGMGTVYCAEHALIGKPAAVKVLLPQYGRDRSIVARFFNEARAVSAIDHPGIVRLYDFGYMDDGSAYIVMELLRGETLAGRIASRGRLTEAEAVAIVRGIAGALGAVHARGIVHRDIKPDNVFLVPDLETTSGERIKVLDFGIAKLTDEPGTLNQTSTNTMLGTPLYMSPEQCRGAGHVDQRADLYALGCVAFEMLAGVPPFLGEGAGEVIAAHLHIDPPALRTLAPEVSAHTERVVAALLAKRADDRPQTAHDLLRMLQPDAAPPASISAAQVTIRMTGADSHPAITTTPASATPVTIRMAGADSHPAITTTLGSAAASVVMPPAPRRSRPLVIAAAAVVALAAAAIVLVVSVRGRPESAARSLAPSSAIDALAPPPPPATADAAPSPQTATTQTPTIEIAAVKPTSPPASDIAASKPTSPPASDIAVSKPTSPSSGPDRPSQALPAPSRGRKAGDPRKPAPKPEALSRRAPVVEDL
jgi:serine/threonine-protein kinase